MSLSKFFTIQLAKRVGKIVFEEALLPMAEEYVKQTDNPYDDTALAFLKDFVNKQLLAE